VLAARGNGGKAAGEALASFPGGAEVWLEDGGGLLAIASEEADSLPAALREVASKAGIDGDALVMAATRVAGRLNGRDIVPGLPEEERYHATRNSKAPRRVDSVLELYDCLNCDLCVSACPNDAIFIYGTEPVSAPTERLSCGSNDGLERAEGEGFVIATDHQLAVFAAACNECSNCEVYCPEEGAPFQVKERIFSAREQFEGSGVDGFLRVGDFLLARLDGREHHLAVDVAENRARLSADGVTVELEWEPLRVLRGRGHNPEFALDTARLWRMKTVWESVYHSVKPNPANPEGQ
jgi:putative selenate reductase